MKTKAETALETVQNYLENTAFEKEQENDIADLIKTVRDALSEQITPAWIVIEIGDGMVQNVLCDVRAEVLKLDYDTEGSLDEDTHEITPPGGGEKVRAFISFTDADFDPQDVEKSFHEGMRALCVPERIQGETARITLPGLTHAEIVDHFTILRGMRDGFGPAHVNPAFDRSSRLETPGAFFIAARQHGGGAEILAGFICDLIHGERFSGSRYSLANLFPRLDSDHRRAVLAVLEQVAMRGIK